MIVKNILSSMNPLLDYLKNNGCHYTSVSGHPDVIISDSPMKNNIFLPCCSPDMEIFTEGNTFGDAIEKVKQNIEDIDLSEYRKKLIQEKSLYFQSSRPDSNRRPTHYECVALPTALRKRLYKTCITQSFAHGCIKMLWTYHPKHPMTSPGIEPGFTP